MDIDKRYFLKVVVQYHENVWPKRMNIEKVERLVANLDDKKEYDILIRTFKQAINHRFVLEKVQCS